MSDGQIAALVIFGGIAVLSWLESVRAWNRVADLERRNRELRRAINDCVSNCQFGKEQAREEEAWRWN